MKSLLSTDLGEKLSLKCSSMHVSIRVPTTNSLDRRHIQRKVPNVDFDVRFLALMHNLKSNMDK